MMKIAGYFWSTCVSRCFRGRSGNISSRSSAWMKVSSSGSGGYRGSFSFGNSCSTCRSAPVITFQIRRTTSLRNTRFRWSAVITRSQSHWSTYEE